MAVFFAGQLHITPAAITLVDDRAMANRNLTVGNVPVVIGRSEGGKPASGITFSNPQQARETLRSGEAIKAIEAMFSPSRQTNGPGKVVFIRVNPATRSTVTIQDGAANDVMKLDSTDYGLYTRQLSFKIEDGTNKGKKLTSQLVNDFYTLDDVYRDALSVQYTGALATSLINITNTQITLEAPAATVVSTIDLNEYDTIQEVVDRINSVTDFTASVTDNNGNEEALNGLDAVTGQDIKTAAYTVTANLQAVVDWFNGNGEGFITATRDAAGDQPPANTNGFVFLTGGSDGIVTNTEWQAAFDAAKNIDIQWVVPITSDPSIHAMTSTHCDFMSNQGKMERRGFVGGANGQTIAQVNAAAKIINSDRIAQCFPGIYDFDLTGKLVLHPSYITACFICGGFSGSNPGTAMTNKTFNVKGVELELSDPGDTDELLLGHVLAMRETRRGFKCVQSVSTWGINANYNRVEVSTGFAVDFVARNVREELELLIGEKGSPITMQDALVRTDTKLRELAREEPVGPGVIVGDAENPAYKNIKVSLEGDVMRVEFQCSPVIPINYIPIVIHAVPYSGTISS